MNILFTPPLAPEFCACLGPVLLLEALMEGQTDSIPKIAARQKCSKNALKEGMALLERHGIVERAGFRMGSVRLKAQKHHETKTRTELISTLLAHVDQHRTALRLSEKLGLERELIEHLLEQATEEGLLERVYVGHLGIYTRKFT